MGISVVMDEGGTPGGAGGGDSGCANANGCCADSDERGEVCVEAGVEAGNKRAVRVGLPLNVVDGAAIDHGIDGLGGCERGEAW